MKFVQLSSLILALAGTALAQDFCQSASHSGEKKEEHSNVVGNIGGVGYELCADSGNNSATFYSDGSFSCTFQNAGDYLCRSGLSFDSTKTPDQIGQLTAQFKLVKSDIQNVGYSYVGVYGWTRDPLVEYYIVDNWLSPDRPGDWVGEKNHGNFDIDGAQYTVYENTRFGPSIDGDTQFKQYFSIRSTARDCGTIDISAHFKQWEALGMKMGKLHEAKVLGEAGNGSGGVSGTADFPYAKVTLGGAGGGGAAPAPAPAAGGAPTAPAADGAIPAPPVDGNVQPGQGQPQGPPQGQDWNQQPPQGQDWNQQGQPQGQPQGQDWNQQPPQGQDWNQQGQQQGQPNFNQDWNQQGQQNWNQDWNQQGQQNWNQDWNQQGQQGQQNWNQDWNQQGQQNWNQGQPNWGVQPDFGQQNWNQGQQNWNQGFGQQNWNGQQNWWKRNYY